MLEARGAQVTLELPEMFGKVHDKVKIRSLKCFEESASKKEMKCFEERDACLRGADLPLVLLVTTDGTARYEINCISNARTHEGRGKCGSNEKVMISRRIVGYTETC